MRKIFITFALVLLGLGANALEVSEGFTYSKAFWQNSVGVSQDLNYMMNIGFNFDLTKHDDIPNHIYTFSSPLMLRSEYFGLLFRPFFIPDNANEASAYGAKLSCTFGLKYDEIEQTSSHAFLSLAFGTQNAYVVKENQTPQKEDFYQLVYEGGFSWDYFGAYFFEISANAFEYLSGISSVEGLGGVLDQQNLAILETLDYVLGLPKGSAGVKIGWNSQENGSETFLSYRYIDFFDKNSAPYNSLKLSSIIDLGSNLFVIFAYNHVFISGKKDKDIFKGALSFKL